MTRRSTVATLLATAALVLGPVATTSAAAAPDRTPDPAATVESGSPVASAAQGLLTNGGKPASTARVVVPMVYPMIGKPTWSDTYLQCRNADCTRRHLGQDMIIGRGVPLVAAFDGTITYLQRGSVPTSPNYITVMSTDQKWTVVYIHLNNDTPGTDDGKGTLKWGILGGLKVGQPVVRGQLLGWVGDSGDAENSTPHLHFELHAGDAWRGSAYNPKPSLEAATRISAPVTAAVHPRGSWLRSPSGQVWHLFANGRRYLASPTVAATWGRSAAAAVPVTERELSYYPNGGVLGQQPGSVLRGPDGTLWVFSDGLRHKVSPYWLTSAGLTGDAPRPVSEADLSILSVAPVGTEAPTALRVGALVREAGAPAVYRIDADGAAHWVTAGYVAAARVAATDIANVPAGTLAAAGMPLGATATLPDGVVVKQAGKPEVWVTWGGQAHWAHNGTWLHAYAWDAVPVVGLRADGLTGTPVGAPVYAP